MYSVANRSTSSLGRCSPRRRSAPDSSTSPMNSPANMSRAAFGRIASTRDFATSIPSARSIVTSGTCGRGARSRSARRRSGSPAAVATPRQYEKYTSFPRTLRHRKRNRAISNIRSSPRSACTTQSPITGLTQASRRRPCASMVRVSGRPTGRSEISSGYHRISWTSAAPSSNLRFSIFESVAVSW